MAPRPFLVSAVAAMLLAGSAWAQHPQAVTDCSNCHQDQSTGVAELTEIHGFNCQWCHTDFNFSRTLLGPLGTWNRECSHCHEPNVIETGNLPTPTKGHRCTVCHGQQMPTANARDFHEEHAESANCVVCHGFVPDVGTAIGSGNRNACDVCHDSGVQNTGLRRIHREMTDEGVSCLECHGGTRPPIDVVAGPPVGNATVVCDICHSGANPGAFATRGPQLHEKHQDEGLDCGACHADAELQDDRNPMPPVDDGRRAQVNRTGFNECAHCHQGGASASIETIHEEHVGEQAQWCSNCHLGTDPRPFGQAPPVTRPRESCQLCHGSSRTYTDDFPFEIHEEHAEEGQKCYSCHQGTPPLFDWPDRWQRDPGTFASYGAGCVGSNGGTPTIGHVGLPRLGRSFTVTLSNGPASAATLLAIGVSSTVLPLATEGMPGCTLYLDPIVTPFLVTNGAGGATFRQAVPVSPRLIGRPFYFQWFAVDPPANTRGLIASDGGRATVGR